MSLAANISYNMDKLEDIMLSESILSQKGNYYMTHHRDASKLVKFTEAVKWWLPEDDGSSCSMSVKFQSHGMPFVV